MTTNIEHKISPEIAQYLHKKYLNNLTITSHSFKLALHTAKPTIKLFAKHSAAKQKRGRLTKTESNNKRSRKN